jgi:hypothetical protein
MATKRELKKIVKIHCACVLLAAESMIAFDDTGLTMEDFGYMDEEINKIALKMLGDNEPIFDAAKIVKAVCGGN